MDTMSDYLEKYREGLNNTIRFWLDHGIDKKHGGLYTCLDRKGEVYCTDKSAWLNGRCVWVFSYLCNVYGHNEEYKQAATHCLDFLNKYFVDPADGRLFFMVSEDGRPLRKRRYFYSEVFYTMGCAEYALAFNDQKALSDARKYYELISSIYRG